MQNIFSHIKRSARKQQEGFVILFTVLIAVIILAMTIGIANVAYKEQVLTINSKESHLAFFAADAGAECALYQDRNQDVFNAAGQADLSITCNGQSIYGSYSPQTGFDGTSYDQYDFNVSSGGPLAVGIDDRSCSYITVKKNFPILAADGSTQLTTRIESLGYNVKCDEVQGSGNNKRQVERAVRVTYLPTVNGTGPGGETGYSPSIDIWAIQADGTRQDGLFSATSGESIIIRWASTDIGPSGCSVANASTAPSHLPEWDSVAGSSLAINNPTGFSVSDTGVIYIYAIDCIGLDGLTYSDSVGIKWPSGGGGSTGSSGPPPTLTFKASSVSSGGVLFNSSTITNSYTDTSGTDTLTYLLPPYVAYLEWDLQNMPSGVCTASQSAVSADGIGVQNWDNGTVVPQNSPAGRWKLIFPDLRGAQVILTCSDGTDTVSGSATIGQALQIRKYAGKADISVTKIVPSGIYAHRIHTLLTGSGGAGGSDAQINTDGIVGGDVRLFINALKLAIAHGGIGGQHAISTNTPVSGGAGGTVSSDLVSFPGFSVGTSSSGPSGSSSNLYTGGAGGLGFDGNAWGAGFAGFSGDPGFPIYGYAGGGGGAGAKFEANGPINEGDSLDIFVGGVPVTSYHIPSTGQLTNVGGGGNQRGRIVIDITN